jgi:hypothetical protein
MVVCLQTIVRDVLKFNRKSLEGLVYDPNPPVLKHGPRSATYMRVSEFLKLTGEMKVIPGILKLVSGAPGTDFSVY